MTDVAFARLAGDAYSALPSGRCYDWRDVRAVVTPGIVAIRGTRPTSMADWVRDVRFWPIRHPLLGGCPAGFLGAAVGLLAALPPDIVWSETTVTGHSLGGAVALLMGGLLKAAGTPAKSVITWEAPRCGGHMLKAIYSGEDVRQYRFGNDPVTEVPWIPGVYEHVSAPLLKIGQDRFVAIECHEIGRIITWLQLQEIAPNV